MAYTDEPAAGTDPTAPCFPLSERRVPSQPDTTSPRFVAISPDDGSVIDLRNPALAALLSWAVPGLGQLYQGRTTKGGLFMATILATFVAGLWLGGGKVVYASWKPTDTRWAYVCQAGAGLVALPALVQSAQLMGAARQPLFASGFMAPPLSPGQYVSRAYAERLARTDPDVRADDFFDKPPLKQFRRDQLAAWHRRLGRFFEIGTLYTMLAGMLNLLVVYDAWAGPIGPNEQERRRRGPAEAAHDSPRESEAKTP